MPTYFIDISDNGRTSVDDVGSELSCDEEARKEAIGVLPDVARDELPDGNEHVFEATVRNKSGRAIFHAKLTLHCVWLATATADQS